MGREQLNADPLPWLLEDDPKGIRYLAFLNLVEPLDHDEEFERAKQVAYTQGPISSILEALEPEGYWAKPGPGYLPKYRSTVWSLILLAQLGAKIEDDARIGMACSYLLDHAFNADGQISSNGPPSGTVDCLQGNICAAFMDLGFDDERVEKAFEWMARSVTGEGLAPNSDRKAELRYYAGKCGPDFACGANNKLACAWGAAKVMLAFGKVPPAKRTALIDAAIRRGIEFLFSVDPATAAYPSGWAEKPSRNWWKLGFPVFYVTDILQIIEALGLHGFGQDERLQNALANVLEQQDDDGRWSLNYDYRGKTWVDFGEKEEANKWVTVRVLNTLKACEA